MPSCCLAFRQVLATCVFHFKSLVRVTPRKRIESTIGSTVLQITIWMTGRENLREKIMTLDFPAIKDKPALYNQSTTLATSDCRRAASSEVETGLYSRMSSA